MAYNFINFIISSWQNTFLSNPFLILDDEPEWSNAEATEPVVFVGSEDHYMYAFGRNGAVSWKFKAYDKIQGTAAFKADGEMLYFGSTDGTVYALLPHNGKHVWAFQTEGAVVATPQVSRAGVVYIGSHDGHFYALDANNGSLIWKKDFRCAFWGGSALEEQKQILYTGCVADQKKPTKEVPRVYALSLINGDVVWTFEEVGNVYASPALSSDGKTVFFGSLDSHVYAFDSETGKLLWAYDTKSEIESSPVVSKLDGTLYIGLVKDQLIALNTLTGPLMGKLQWTVNTGGETVSSPVITEDGRVSVPSC